MSDLNNYLFEQIERINDDSLDDNELEVAIKRADAINSVAKTIIDNAKVTIEAQKVISANDWNANNIKVDMKFLGVVHEG